MRFCNENDTHKKRLNKSNVSSVLELLKVDTYHNFNKFSATRRVQYRPHNDVTRFVRFGSFSKLHQRKAKKSKKCPVKLIVESPKKRILLRIIIYVVLACCY